MKFDGLFKGTERISDTEYRVSSLKRASLIVPKGIKIFDEGTSTWYVGDGSTVGGIELADTAGGAIVGNLTGNVTGDLLGNVTGNVAGVVVGSLIGDSYFEPTAGGTIPANRLVEIDSSGDFVVGTIDSLLVVGVNQSDEEISSSELMQVAQGYSTVVTATPVKAGTKIKCGDNGRVTQLVTDDVAGTVIASDTGIGFTNQPANDGITIVSDDNGDNQTVTIIGTTHGGVIITSEDIVLTGTTPANSVKVDWGKILAIKLSAQTAGTLTVKETSGGATIIAVSGGLGTTSVGVISVAAESQGAFNVKPKVVASDTSSAVVGVKKVSTNGVAVSYEGATLNDTTDVELTEAASLITEFYIGDVANTVDATVKVGSSEYLGRCVGKALETASAAGTTIQAFLTI